MAVGHIGGVLAREAGPGPSPPGAVSAAASPDARSTEGYGERVRLVTTACPDRPDDRADRGSG
ncbi:hypothetical protein GT352_34555 [Streptomyces sp. SID1046]|uniref:hypothetical protein n=1 Tax=Streptomyces sp. SID1046 TaxID=2690249 RepID=UPI00136CABC1|nr:hypothetical protein [Streptomyces sp. SID1046]MYV78999.1 hypothetical protein [Streptomyces sp. SID1046]